MAIDKIPASSRRSVRSLFGKQWTTTVKETADGSFTIADDRLRMVLLAEILREIKLLRADQKRELRRLTMAVERLPKGATP